MAQPTAEARGGPPPRLVAELPASAAPAEQLLLREPLDARTWTVAFGADGGEKPLEEALAHLAASFGGELLHVFVQFRMDNLGRHEYVCLGEVEQLAAGNTLDSTLGIVLEDEVKALKQQLPHGAVTVLAALPPELRLPRTGAAPPPRAPEEDADLCPPRGLFRNYSLCEELALGRTQRVMLCDESTLHSGVQKNGIKIFNHLSLIVNCHETAAADRPGKYSVGSAKPHVIFQPIHQLMRASPQVVIEVMNEIQREIWARLQEGSVAVHCLAGVHRAPTVVVCQYLYRHYVLGQSQIDSSVERIYRTLRAVRPGVEPLGYIVLIDIYQKYLVETYGGSRAA